MIQSILYQFAEVKETEINGQKQQNVYLFTVTPGAPWEHMYQALDEFRAKIQEHEAKALADAEALKNKDQVVAEPESVIEPEVITEESPLSE